MRWINSRAKPSLRFFFFSCVIINCVTFLGGRIRNKIKFIVPGVIRAAVLWAYAQGWGEDIISYLYITDMWWNNKRHFHRSSMNLGFFWIRLHFPFYSIAKWVGCMNVMGLRLFFFSKCIVNDRLWWRSQAGLSLQASSCMKLGLL